MLNWRGEQVHDNIMRRTGRAMDSVLADSVADAKENVRRRTAVLQGGIQYRPTELTRSGLVGFFGVFSVMYAIFVEKGTKPHWPPIDAIMRGMKVTRSHAFLIARSISRKGTKAYPFLVPAANRFFPDLARRLKSG